jgi:hypothetical protein
MDTTPTQTFKNYAWFSVQVDQYYSAVRIYARHHNALKQIYQAIPSREEWPKGEEKVGIPETVKKLFITSASTFSYMGTTGIFSNAPYLELTDLPQDMINLGFYTCFCFQWTLFENFVKTSVLNLVQDGLLPSVVSSELKKKERATAKFLEYIDSGAVFGKSPFITVIPIKGWIPKTETCDYTELDNIRKLRNQFIHVVKARNILNCSEIEKEQLYERSMWIMRKFAENVDYEVMQLRERSEP